MAVTVTSLRTYPLKSAQENHQDRLNVGPKGIAGDRILMVVDEQGRALTARDNPELLKISVQLSTDMVELSDGQSTLSLSLADATGHLPDKAKVTLWGRETAANIFSEEASAWLSERLGGMFFLVVKDNLRPRPYRFGGVHAFGDSAPLLLISEQSLTALNEKLFWPVDMAHFRPNIVVEASEPFIEDSWRKIRIGDAVFQLSEPCPRCIFTTLSPRTRRFDLTGEPLRTLATFRRNEAGKVNFGQYMTAETEGAITIGDEIEVIERRVPAIYPVSTLEENGAATPSPSFNLRCVNKVARSSKITSFIFTQDPPAPFGFKAGQYAVLNMKIGGKRVNRCYSVSSSPLNNHQIEVSVSRKPGGVASNWLHDELNIGDTLGVSGFFGDFHADDTPEQPHLMLSAGSGITPMVSMVKWHVHKPTTANIVHLHFEKTASDVAFANQLQQLSDYEGSNYQFFISETAKTDRDQVLQGRLTVAHLNTLVPDFNSRKIYLCGPEAFLDHAKNLLVQQGVDPLHIEQEQFTVVEQDLNNDASGETFTMSVCGKNETAEIAAGQSILAAASNASIDIPSACQAGICGTCRCRIADGEVYSSSRMGLHPDDDDSIVLACCTFAKTDLKIELI